MPTLNHMVAQIPIPPDEIIALCRRYHIRHLALFGSVLRSDFTPNSDVDILVEFAPGKVPGLGFIDIQDELSALVGRKVDLNTPGFLSSRIRQNVMEQSETIYGTP
ncbi:MAG: nucleotidyltransferase family protein [Gammaproteobacteria bacterium]|nr:nucleotidyltransferase family protein [Gammaproteobacteria bacterium]